MVNWTCEVEVDANHELLEFCGFFKKSNMKKGTKDWINCNCEELHVCITHWLLRLIFNGEQNYNWWFLCFFYLYFGDHVLKYNLLSIWRGLAIFWLIGGYLFCSMKIVNGLSWRLYITTLWTIIWYFGYLVGWYGHWWTLYWMN